MRKVWLWALGVAVSSVMASAPAPFEVQTPSGDDPVYTEFDGFWSTFNIQVGSQDGGQNFRFVPSMTGVALALANPGTCAQSYLDQLTGVNAYGVPSSQQDCSTDRGVGLYNGGSSTGYVTTRSSTATQNGTQAFILAGGVKPETLYGTNYIQGDNLDTDFVFFSNNSGSSSQATQTPISTPGKVGIFDDSNIHYYLPMLGLNVGGLQVTDNEVDGTLKNLFDGSIIPSRSWGYTAGAHYRGTQGSLVLGGVDQARFDPNTTQTIKLASGDEVNNLVVEVESLSLDFSGSSTGSGPNGQGATSYSGTPFNAILDSTLPYFYLPSGACTWFQQNLNLQLNTTSVPNTSVYTVNAADATKNNDTTSNVVFNIRDPNNDKASITVNIPYQAFQVSASWVWGFTESATLFPVMPMNGTTAILGRPFFQEVYVSANYEDDFRHFNVSKVADPSSSSPQLIALPLNTTGPINGGGGGGGSSLSGGAIAGIAIGAVAVVALLVLGFFFYRRRTRRRAVAAADAERKAKELEPMPPLDSGVMGAAAGERPRANTYNSDWSQSGATEVDDGQRPEHRRHQSGVSELSNDGEMHPKYAGSPPLGTVQEMDTQTKESVLAEWSQRAREAEMAGHEAPPAPFPRHEMEGSSDWMNP